MSGGGVVTMVGCSVVGSGYCVGCGGDSGWCVRCVVVDIWWCGCW